MFSVHWMAFLCIIYWISYLCVYTENMCMKFKQNEKKLSKNLNLFLKHPPVHFEFDTIYIPCILIGEYSCLKVDLLFKREFSYYLIQIYIPCCMLVIVSWVSFWLDQGAVPARVSLGEFSFYILFTHQLVIFLLISCSYLYNLWIYV